MITKGIVEELKGYQAKVRLPIYDGLANTKNATSNENLSYATVCVTTNLNNSLNVGDIVYVSFEDNDKGKPVILGQLYKEEMNTLADIKLNSANINQLTVNKNASLPQNTSIGSISFKEIAALSGIKDNIQNQIDINLPAINFAESERQKSKNLVEIKNGINVTYSTGMHVETSNDIVTVSGTVTGGTAHNITTFMPKIYNGKTYTLSFHNYLNLSNFEIAVTGTRTDGTKKYNMLNISSATLSKTITADDDYTLKIEVYSTANKTISGTFKLQLEEGSVATNYQPYNGAVVHEKQLPKITTLWTNPNPSNDFSSQTITLANDNYDYAIMICVGRSTEVDTQVSFLFEKGASPILNYVLTNDGETYSAETICRRVYHTNNTTLNVQDCYYSLKSTSAITANNLLIPYKVIGIKIGE